MHEYKNPNYISKVNDFGDDYHKPEAEVFGIDRELLKAIRSLKKRYRDFDEWCDAMNAYREYSQFLIDKYGGKKRLKTLHRLGMVSDYIPFFPELRKIKKNRKYYKDGINREDKLVEKMNVPDYTESRPLPEHIEFEFSFSMNKKKCKEIEEAFFDDNTKKRITETLNVISDFYRGKVKTTGNLSDKALKKRELEKRYRKGETGSRWKQYKKYQEEMWEHDYEEDRIDPDAYIYYKDTTVSIKDSEEIDLYETLKKIGLQPGGVKLSKDARKVVRRSDPSIALKKLKKKNKKKKGKLRNKYVRQFTGDKYDSFSQFEKDVMSLTAKVFQEEG